MIAIVRQNDNMLHLFYSASVVFSGDWKPNSGTTEAPLISPLFHGAYSVIFSISGDKIRVSAPPR